MRRWVVARQFFNAVIHAMLIVGNLPPVGAQVASAPAPIQRHPLEIRALTEPDAVLRALPALLQKASAEKDFKEQALLSLAGANACRVIADWPCQANSAAQARVAAKAANQPELQVRGLILESRGRMAMQDFSRTAQLLSEAEKILATQTSPELSADVYLAHSSLSYTVGKHVKAAEYAERGLAALGDNPSLLVRIRLLRNQARAMAQLGNAPGARAVLKQALALIDKVQDPKLNAELHLEDARIARLTGDVASQVDNGRRILALGSQLNNSQLAGLGHEVLGLAALNQSNMAAAERELRLAYESFKALKLERDERRVLRALISSVLGRGIARADLENLMARLVSLQAIVEDAERSMAADDFEARLKYAQQELDVQKLEASAALSAHQSSALADQQRLTLIVAILSMVLLLVFGVLFVLQRRFSFRLEQVVTQLRESEGRYRMLADNSRDLVVRMRLDGQRLYVSPATRDMLGIEPAELMASKWDLVHPDDREMLRSAIRELGEKGGSSTIVYRARHANGDYIWIEALARLVTDTAAGNVPEIIYSGRDITARVRAEQALSLSEHSMRAITDNIPALIAHVDKDQRYTFANAYMGKVFGTDPKAMIGRTMREVRGEKIYADIEAHIAAALRGETVSFEGSGEANGRLYYYQSNYVPDRDANGSVMGFFALTFDITELKLAEAKLDRLARIDSLTGVANRRFFEERLANALARSRRQATALALLWLDIDHFKSINDQHGHSVGDAVIIAFANRLQSCVREDDLVARLGGDEFILMIENAGEESAVNVARKLLAMMQAPVEIGAVTLHITASIGVVRSLRPQSAKTLMDLADQALYAAKTAGRNTYRVAAT